MTVVEARCFRECQDTDGEDSGRYEGETEGDLPGGSFPRLVPFRSVVEDGG